MERKLILPKSGQQISGPCSMPDIRFFKNYAKTMNKKERGGEKDRNID